MSYAPHDAFIAPARATAHLWRTLVGLLLIVGLWALWTALTFLALAIVVGGMDEVQVWMQRLSGEGATPISTLVVLSTFIGMAIGPFLIVRFLHRRRGAGLFGPPRRTLSHFAIGAAICAGVYALTALIPGNLQSVPALDPRLWAMLLPLALVALLVQTGAEEVLFRGYLQQQLAARFRSPVWWMILPSALFALLHYQPAQMGENAWIVVLAVFLFAILAADLTARTGSIGAAWGFHFANNAVAILFVSMSGPLSGLSLYLLPQEAMDPAALRPLLFLDMVTTLGTYALIRYVVTRRP